MTMTMRDWDKINLDAYNNGRKIEREEFVDIVMHIAANFPHLTMKGFAYVLKRFMNGGLIL